MITRDAIAPYAEALAPLGLEALALPVTRFAPPREPDALARAVTAGGYAAIVVASARAAAALAEAIGGRAAVVGARDAAVGAAAVGAREAAFGARSATAVGATALPEVWAVGPATARALADAGIAAQLPATAKDGASLAKALVAARALAGRRVLVPRAEDGRDDAIAILAAAGAEVDAVTAYRTIAAPADDPALERGLAVLRRGEAAVCALFAPSQVAALAGLVELRAIATRFAAIGDTTAAALRAAGVAEVAVAGTPTPEGLAKAVLAVYPHKP